LKEVQERRGEFTREEWRDLVLRSIGVEPAMLSDRVKILYLARLIITSKNSVHEG
jgi:ATP-dependent Lon protease